jgi:hypothetical protein
MIGDQQGKGVGGIYPLITIYPTFSQRGYSQFSGELLACDYLTNTIKI